MIALLEDLGLHTQSSKRLSELQPERTGAHHRDRPRQSALFEDRFIGQNELLEAVEYLRHRWTSAGGNHECF